VTEGSWVGEFKLDEGMKDAQRERGRRMQRLEQDYGSGKR